MMNYPRPLNWLSRLGITIDSLATLRGAKFSQYLLACITGLVIGLICLISPILAIGAVLGIAFAVVALSRPIILCYTLIPVIALTSGMERGRIVPFLKPGEVTLVLSMAIVVLMLLVNRRRRKVNFSYGISAFVLYIPGVVLVPLAAYLLRGTPLTIQDIFWLVAPLQYFLLFWLFAIMPETEADRQRLVLLMLLSSSIVALVGLGQAANLGFVNRILVSWYPSGHLEAGSRLTSLMGAWNSLGILMMTTLLISWSILLTTSNMLHKAIVIVVFTLSAICLLASGSFAGIGGLAMGLVIIEVLSQRGLRIVPILIGGLVVLALTYLILQPILGPLVEDRLKYQFGTGESTPQTLSYRFYVWRDVFWPPIRENFPWPVHPTVPANYVWEIEESQYIMLLFRLGITGFLGHLAWVSLTLVWLYRKFRQSVGFSKAVVTSVLALVIVLSISGWTNSVFTFAGSIDYLWITLGLIANTQEI